MRRLICASLFLLCAPIFASGSLWPAGHTTCINANNMESLPVPCPEGKEFYVDDSGRCGCLSQDEYVPAETCMAAHIICEENTTFAGIFRAREMCGRSQVGCGCFSTDGEVTINSVDGVQ